MFNRGTTAETVTWEEVEGEQQNYEEQQWNEQCATPKGKERKKKRNAGSKQNEIANC